MLANIGGGYGCLDDYNTFASLFAVIGPAWSSSGSEAGLTTTMQGANGNDNTDYGIQQYGSTGIDAYQNYYSTTYAQPLPEPDFSFWEQANGNTSKSATAWHWLIATSTPFGAFGTTTSICMGDVGSTTISAFTNCGISGATIQIMSSSSRPTLLSVSEVTNNVLSQIFSVNQSGATTTNISDLGSLWLTSIANPTGSFLATDPNGKFIATTSPILSLANGTGISCASNGTSHSGSCSFSNQSANTVLVNQSASNGVPTGMATSTFGIGLYSNTTLRVSTTTVIGSFSVGGASFGTTNGVCHQEKAAGTASSYIWYYFTSGGAQVIQTATCSGAGTTTITTD